MKLLYDSVIQNMNDPSTVFKRIPHLHCKILDWTDLNAAPNDHGDEELDVAADLALRSVI